MAGALILTEYEHNERPSKRTKKRPDEKYKEIDPLEKKKISFKLSFATPDFTKNIMQMISGQDY